MLSVIVDLSCKGQNHRLAYKLSIWRKTWHPSADFGVCFCNMGREADLIHRLCELRLWLSKDKLSDSCVYVIVRR